LSLESDCEAFINDLSWTNPNTVCDTVDDVIGYRIYYTPIENGEFEQIAAIQGSEELQRTFTNLESVAGCYYVTAIDSFQNESDPSNILCVDNCPVYRLPNIITPGGDGYNDVFEPFPYRFVESIELSVFNRWGTEVFSTTDPNIQWDGTDQNSGGMVPDGVYFYVCTVNEIRLNGVVPRVIKGNLTIMSQVKRSSGN
jgi:gliding motility-associated-like protein